MQSARKAATYEDLVALPEGERAEILGGVVVNPPAPLPRHALAQRTTARFIGGPFDDDDGRGGPGGWWILLEVDVRLGPSDIVRPDLAGWRRDRLPVPWDMRPIDVTPDWICEIISPSNASNDRVKKRRLYATHAVPFYWIVDSGGAHPRGSAIRCDVECLGRDRLLRRCVHRAHRAIRGHRARGRPAVSPEVSVARARQALPPGDMGAAARMSAHCICPRAAMRRRMSPSSVGFSASAAKVSASSMRSTRATTSLG